MDETGAPADSLRGWFIPHARLMPPPLPSHLVRRPALRDKLIRDVSSTGVTLLCAPAGYGKTVLLSDWIEATGRADKAWVSLDCDDNADRMLVAIVGAVRECAVVPPASGLAALRTAESPDTASLLADTVNAIAAVPAQLYLVLDDVQDMSGGNARRALAALIRHQPANLRLVMASRSNPPLPLARWRVQGALAEMRANDLRFSPDDAARLVHNAGVELTDDQLDRLVAQTDGWAAGLRLAARSLSHTSDPEWLLAGGASDDRAIADFLDAEVLAGLPEETRHLLRVLSLCDDVEPRLASWLSGQDDAADILAELDRDSPLVVSTGQDRQRYRLHPLLRSHLRADLLRHQPLLASEVHARAVAWFAAEGRPFEALRHAEQTGDARALVALLRDHAIDMLLHGEPELVRRGLTAAGAEVVGADPWLLLCSALAHLQLGAFPAAESDLDRCTAVWPADATEAQTTLRRLVGSALAFARGRHRRQPDPGSRDDVVAGGSAELEVWLRLDSGLTLGRRGDHQGARRELRSAGELSRARDVGYLAMHVRVVQAMVDAMAGDCATMEASCDEALALSRRGGWARSPWLAVADGMRGLARLLHLDPSGALESAEWLMDAEPRWLKFLSGLLTGAARFDQGDRIHGVHLLWANRRDVGDEPLPDVLAAIGAVLEHQATLLVCRRPLAREIWEWAVRRLGTTAETSLIDARMTFVHGDDAGTERALRLVLAQRSPAAIPVTEVEAWLLAAAVSLRAERRTSARESLGAALSVAETAGIVRPFRYAESGVRQLMLDQIGGFGEVDGFAGRVRRALAAADGAPDEPVLTGRERDVLALLMSPLPLDDVAAELRVSVNTVKTHVRAIYTKLGVDNRRAAVVVARQRGLA